MIKYKKCIDVYGSLERNVFMNIKKHILIVDDVITNLKYICEILKGKFDLALCRSGKEALAYLREHTTDLVLLDINLPEMNGFDIMRRLKRDKRTSDIPVIFITMDSDKNKEIEGLELGASDFIIRPFDAKVISRRIDHAIEEAELKRQLESQIKNKTKQLEETAFKAMSVIVEAVDLKGKYSAGHSVRVAKCAGWIARKLGWNEKDVSNIYFVALLHDIGNICISDETIGKPSKLTDEEFEEVKKHPFFGSDILKEVTSIKGVADGAMYHHERFDGKGYNYGLKGYEIPIIARIINVADAYDAMTGERVYRESVDIDTVKAEFEKGKGAQFDPAVVDAMLELIDEGIDFSEDFEISDDIDSKNLAEESTKLLKTILEKYTDVIKVDAQKDSLTGAWNRKYTENRVNFYLGDKASGGALFMMDMDNFKGINDTFGHGVGDRMLVMFADILKSLIRETDILCRIGGDEFIIFFKGRALREDIANKAKAVLNKISEKLIIPETDKKVNVSIGISVSGENGNDFATLYNNADKALYYVKQNGKGSYHFFSEENDEPEIKTETKIDIEYVRDFLKEKDFKNGVYQVEYEGFQKIYRFLDRTISRTKQVVQLLLFTLTDQNGGVPNFKDNDEVLALTEKAISVSLRRGDVSTSYNKSRFIVILMDATHESGLIVAERIVNNFYSLYDKGNIILHYDIQEMQNNEDKN